MCSLHLDGAHTEEQASGVQGCPGESQLGGGCSSLRLPVLTSESCLGHFPTIQPSVGEIQKERQGYGRRWRDFLEGTLKCWGEGSEVYDKVGRSDGL